MTEILDKTKDWSDRFGSVLRASAETQYPHLYKGAVGGIEHVISVDNGAYYMEMWRDGSDNYYATTGAAIKPLPGLAKGARLDEALDRFFHLMAKVEKDKAAMKRRLNMDYPPTASGREQVTDVGGAWRDKPGGPRRADSGMRLPAKKAIPKKIKRLLGLAYGSAPPGLRREPSGRLQPKPYPASRPKPVKKRVMEKVDPQIGPGVSVGQRKPSDLSPESGVSKLVKRMILDLTGEPTAQMRKQMKKNGEWTPGSAKKVVDFSRRASEYKPTRPPKAGGYHGVKKNVVALTAPGGVGNQPGSGRVKPGTPPKTYNSPQGFSGRRMGGPGTPGAPAGTSGAGIKTPKVHKDGTNLGQKTKQRRAPYVGSRPGGGGPSPLLRRGRKIDDITGGRVSGPTPPPGVDTPKSQITPVKPAMGGPGQPTGYGSAGMPQYSYGRKAAKDCGCGPAAEVRKAVRAVAKAVRR